MLSSFDALPLGRGLSLRSIGKTMDADFICLALDFLPSLMFSYNFSNYQRILTDEQNLHVLCSSRRSKARCKYYVCAAQLANTILFESSSFYLAFYIASYSLGTSAALCVSILVLTEAVTVATEHVFIDPPSFLSRNVPGLIVFISAPSIHYM